MPRQPQSPRQPMGPFIDLDPKQLYAIFDDQKRLVDYCPRLEDVLHLKLVPHEHTIGDIFPELENNPDAIEFLLFSNHYQYQFYTSIRDKQTQNNRCYLLGVSRHVNLKYNTAYICCKLSA